MDCIQGSHELPDFSTVPGGPPFQLLVRSHLYHPGSRPGEAEDCLHPHVRLAAAPAPLLGRWKSLGGIGLPFPYDIEMQVRFMPALPLLVFAEFHVHQRARLAVGQFTGRDGSSVTGMGASAVRS
jgi:hypothetical protein